MRLARFVLASVLLALMFSLQVGSSSAQTSGAPRTLTVPRDVPTIQQAINQVTNGGTVFILPGSYSETVDIVGKQVNLVGSGPNGAKRPIIAGAVPAYIVPFDNVRGIINYGRGGGGRLENLMLIGADAGVHGLADGGGKPLTVSIKNVSMIRNGRGVAGTFTALNVTASVITESLLHGVSLQCTPLKFANSHVGNSKKVGIRVVSCDTNANTDMHAVLNNATITDNAGGGAIFIGAMQVNILASKFLGNGGVGIWYSDLVTTNLNLIFKTIVAGTKTNDASQGYADGVILANSGTVTVLSSDLVANGRAGVILDTAPAKVRLVTTSVTQNQYGIVYANGAVFVDDVGNNISGNTGQNIIGDGNLPVPPPPPIPDQ